MDFLKFSSRKFFWIIDLKFISLHFGLWEYGVKSMLYYIFLTILCIYHFLFLTSVYSYFWLILFIYLMACIILNIPSLDKIKCVQYYWDGFFLFLLFFAQSTPFSSLLFCSYVFWVLGFLNGYILSYLQILLVICILLKFLLIFSLWGYFLAGRKGSFSYSILFT